MMTSNKVTQASGRFGGQKKVKNMLKLSLFIIAIFVVGYAVFTWGRV
jgi:hypothetical protein